MGRRGRVLVCEDDDVTRELFVRLIDAKRFDIASTPWGEAALVELLKGDVDCAFIDIGLPDLSGLEVAKQTRAAQSARRPRLVAVTGYGTSSDFARSRASGFDLHLVKPIHLEQITAVLSTIQPG